MSVSGPSLLAKALWELALPPKVRHQDCACPTLCFSFKLFIALCAAVVNGGFWSLLAGQSTLGLGVPPPKVLQHCCARPAPRVSFKRFIALCATARMAVYGPSLLPKALWEVESPTKSPSAGLCKFDM
ncbi:hypothetical protein NDU88_006972 [Pleurodeles waltl]|uniref:Uncharacterized protein n=1 Tax=Pleurodeles waltl TaxID=8319 RepID=A0AAV7TYQ9_PLEWA|nr:hypothetical protein NDU88_006972 [Pleurodeles waltl]